MFNIEIDSKENEREQCLLQDDEIYLQGSRPNTAQNKRVQDEEVKDSLMYSDCDANEEAEEG